MMLGEIGRRIAYGARSGFESVGSRFESAFQRELSTFARPEQMTELEDGMRVVLNWPDNNIKVGDRVVVKAHQNFKKGGLECVVAKTIPNGNLIKVELQLQKKDQ